MLDGARIFHVNVNCSDLARSRAFYVNGCGLVEGVRTTPDAAQSGLAFGLDRARWDAWILVGAKGFDGGAIDLLEWQEPKVTGIAPAALHEAGLQRIGIQVPDLDAALANTAADGGSRWGEPNVHTLPDGGQIRIAFVSDPDGVAIELVESATFGLSFVSVTCADLERSVAFYHALGFRELARFPSANASGSALTHRRAGRDDGSADGRAGPRRCASHARRIRSTGRAPEHPPRREHDRHVAHRTPPSRPRPRRPRRCAPPTSS